MSVPNDMTVRYYSLNTCPRVRWAITKADRAGSSNGEKACRGGGGLFIDVGPGVGLRRVLVENEDTQ